MENTIFYAKNFDIRKNTVKKQNKNKAKTNKTKLRIHWKHWSNPFAVLTCASVTMWCFQYNTVSALYSVHCRLCILYTYEWNKNCIIALSYVLYVTEDHRIWSLEYNLSFLSSLINNQWLTIKNIIHECNVTGPLYSFWKKKYQPDIYPTICQSWLL